jgi:phosphoglycerate dehydrogenase-like enzyme
MEGAGPAILITSQAYATPEALAGVRAIAPAAAVFGPEDWSRDPALIERIDIVFGRLPAEAFARAGRLKWIHTPAAGADWAQRDPARSHPAVVTNSHIHAAAIAEHLFGLLLMLVHGLHDAHRRQLAATWTKRPEAAPDVLAGKTLGVVGLGAIGRRCAELGAAFGMHVVGVRRSPRPTPPAEAVYGPGELCQALARCQVVMVVLPSTAETAGLIGRRELAALPAGAYLLNAGRGKTVDTDALVDALASGHLAGAGLDVVDPEPLPPGHALWRMPNVLITPHTSGLHRTYVAEATAVFLDNLRRLLASQPMVGLVDKTLGY